MQWLPLDFVGNREIKAKRLDQLDGDGRYTSNTTAET